MKAVIAVIRPLACLGAAVVVVIGARLAGGEEHVGLVAAAALSAFLIVAACNTVNDIIDVTADLTNRPDRPIPSGRLPRRRALVVACLAGVAGLIVAASIRPAAGLLATAFLTAGVLYSLGSRRMPMMGQLWVAALFGAAAWWGGFVMGAVPAIVWWAGLIVACFLLPRELLKTAADAAGDSIAGKQTIAVHRGRQVALRAMVATEVLFAAISLVPFVLEHGDVRYLAVMWAGAVLPLVTVTIWLWRKVDDRIRRAEDMTAVIWVTGLSALLLLK